MISTLMLLYLIYMMIAKYQACKSDM